MVSVVKPRVFVFIMIALLQLNIFSKNMMQGYYILILMPTMVMVYNGLFMMTLMFVHYQFMKLGDTYFQGQEV